MPEHATQQIRRPPVWIFGPSWDLFISLCWLPVFGVAHFLSARSALGDPFMRRTLAFALLVSFLHQPLTLGLVYGDPAQFRLHPRLYTVAPLIAVTVGMAAASFGWSVVVPVAALWNLQHTLQQRYGIQRIYAGRSGYGSAGLDRALSYVPMIAVLALVAASPRTPLLVARSGLDQMNAGGVKLLTDLRPEAFVVATVAIAATVVIIRRVYRIERAAGDRANPAKWLYQGSSLALLASIVVDPAAGLTAYVCAHAVEYAVVVDRTAKRRYGVASVGGHAEPASLLGHAARNWAGRVAFFAAIALAALCAHQYLGGSAYNAVLYSVGALHFTYDAVIWKLRKPAVAKDFSIGLGPAMSAG